MGKHLASLTKGFGGVVVRPPAFHFKGRGFDSQSGFLNVTQTESSCEKSESLGSAESTGYPENRIKSLHQ